MYEKAIIMCSILSGHTVSANVLYENFEKAIP